MPATPTELKILRKLTRDATAGLEMYTPDETIPVPISSIRDMRRGRRMPRPDDGLTLLLTENDEGELEWRESGRAAVMSAGGRRALRRGPRRSLEAPSNVVEQWTFKRLEPNKLVDFLINLDGKLTPNQGLFELPGAIPPRDPQSQLIAGHSFDPSNVKPDERILLWIHGTFSSADHLLHEVQDAGTNGKDGAEFLKRVFGHYHRVLYFNHATLSVSAVLNALDLARRLKSLHDKGAQVDVVCHSRGGLVARWWIEVFGGVDLARRAVLVGSPLAGTSLAAPPRLRAVANLLSNYARALSLAGWAASAVMPLMAAAAGLMKIVASATSIVANTPMFDAALSMIPGLACQSRVGNNAELLRLREESVANAAGPVPAPFPGYYAIRANFAPEKVGLKLWKYVTEFKERAIAMGANAVFDGRNDLVVDTGSMTSLSDNCLIDHAAVADPARIKTFDGDTVHHVNYFRQPETLAFIAQSLQIP